MEKVFTLTQGDGKVIERVIADENVHYNHMILPEGEGLPLHKTNATVYMTVVRGILTLSLDGGEAAKYQSGTVLKLPQGAEMSARNEDGGVLELTVVKAPAPVK